VRIVKFLIENGADIEHRDKAGYAPLDFAAMNNHTELVKLLLDNGASVMRENHLLVAQRVDVLANVTDPECYRLLNSKTRIIKATMKVEADRVAELKAIEDQKADIKKKIEAFDAHRAKTREKNKALKDAEHLKQIRLRILEENRDEMKQVLGTDNADSNYK
jgi:Ankyrin repeats (many copies)